MGDRCYEGMLPSQGFVLVWENVTDLKQESTRGDAS
jgi:hypothetical protein